MSKLKSDFQHKVDKLYRLSVCGRWLVAIFSWLTLGVYAIWNLRAEIALCLDYFTWAAVYYGLHFNFLPTLCLAFCIGTTVSVVLWQSRNLIWGLPETERRKLERHVKKIMAKGTKHPLWKLINN
ncbi:MAG: hypothetical protein ACFCAD_07415 [Pleurocapsa sp.]